MKYFYNIFTLVILLFFLNILSCKQDEPNPVNPGVLQLITVKAGDTNLSLSAGSGSTDVPVNQPFNLSFSSPVDTASASDAVSLNSNGTSLAITITYTNGNKTIVITPKQDLTYQRDYQLTISNRLNGAVRETFNGADISFTTVKGNLDITAFRIDGKSATGSGQLSGISKDLNIQITFSKPVEEQTVNENSITLKDNTHSLPLAFSFSEDQSTVTITSTESLKNLYQYSLAITDQIKGTGGESSQYLSRVFYSTYDSVPVMPVINDDALLNKIEEQTFKYFWDFGHPVSGMARERNTSGDVVTTGGSGFGLMALVVGMSRGFITREEGITRIQTIVDFLEKADRFHGVWPHWLNGSTGRVVPFSPKDDGGDLVETSYMAMGLLTVRQYLNPSDPIESSLIDKINQLWEGIDWTWYTQGGQNALYWHWSPDFDWAINMPVRGYDEALITYIMAASSPTHSINADVYNQGWAGGSGFVNGKSFYGFNLPLGPDYGGPLFFEQYTYLGLNPNGLSDSYADYHEQVTNHTLINRQYCIENPKTFIGYGPQCWGLTASDNQDGYSAQSPTNDLGVITPTAAISSLPYTPEYSMDAIRFFYYTLGDRLWGQYGFYDAFNLTDSWTANSYLAIDEGPIIGMIENYRTGLLWNLFMSCPEVKSGLNKLGFTVN